MRFALFALWSWSVASAAVPLRAQTVDMQVGASTFDGDHEPEIGVRVSPKVREVVGVDFSFDAYPRLLVIGALVGMTDLSFAAQVRPAAPVALVVRAGGSALLGVGGGGAIALTGYHAGVGIVLTADTRTTVRFDYTLRRLRVERETYPVPSFTLGFTVHRQG